jgi:serine/threonine protein kinase
MIAGYALVERIGAGGYGEVWRAEAPGGLAKAVKFVFGYLDDQRASAESKALARIKEVRHPFLLSLERIEIIDGQLMIVTELADQSLKDRYEQCRSEGLTGIPREELLQHMQDAADALDYMSQRYSLQHLDIKPENLLILGGRLKVADFGLVKDIHGETVSMPMGLTPVYAAPEVFDGNPSLHSDQYSLAIVYQELLTGILPFPGRTPAQLAAQHLNSTPRLTSLPVADREVVARALAKNPKDRFSTCRQLVDQLVAASRGSSEVVTERPRVRIGDESEVPTSPTVSQRTLPANSADIQPADAALHGEEKTLQLPDPRPENHEAKGAAPQAAATPEPDEIAQIRDLPPLEISPAEYCFRPTLFLGIGGAASRALQLLRRRLNDRFDDLSAVPSLKMLLLDTDVKALAQASRNDKATALRPNETIALPLRRCQDYRDDSEKLLLWLSRRWLYNIPRSLQTEGLRPLGRLAFVDRAQSVLEQIRAAIASIMAPEALAASRQAVGMDVSDAYPRVFIVASISGGTGSGMVLDVGYAVRNVLADLGLSQEGICGLLTYSTGRNPAQSELAAANAHACLSELAHYNRTGHYPGDPDGLLPAVQGKGPFAHTYLVHLGDDLDEKQLDSSTDELAEYLYLNSVTGAGAFFDKCRQDRTSPSQPSSETQQLRTFSVYQFGCSQNGFPAAATEFVCKKVVERWHGDDRQYEEAGRLASQQAAEMQLNAEQLVEQAIQFVEKQQLGNGPVPPPGGSAHRVALATYFDDLATERSKSISDWIIQQVNDPDVRVRGAQRSAQWLVEHLKTLEAELSERLKTAEDQLAVAVQRAAPKKSGWRTAPSSSDAPAHAAELDSPEILPYRLRQLALDGALKCCRTVARQIANLAGRLGELKRELDCLASEFKAPATLAEIANGLQDTASSIVEPLQAQIPDLIRQIDEQFQAAYFTQQGGICCLLKRDTTAEQALLSGLRATTRTVVLNAIKQINISTFFSPTEQTPNSDSAGLHTCLNMATARLLVCGAAKRLLLIAPENANAEAARQAVEQQYHEQPTVVVDSGGDIVLCQEAEQLSLQAVAAYLANHRDQIPQLASRLHTRIDVQWKPLA